MLRSNSPLETQKRSGLDFIRVELNFIYSFLWRIPEFSRLAKAVRASLPFKNNNHSEPYYWYAGVHPQRIGLAPLLHFGSIPGPDEFTSAGEDAPEISCYTRKQGPFEIRTDIREALLNRDDASPTGLAIFLGHYDVLFRLADNGEGTVTFRFVIERDNLPNSFPEPRREEMLKAESILRRLGLLPFIFTVLTLGRTEARGISNGAPLSKLRFVGDKQSNTTSFKTLSELFHEFLYDKFLATLESAISGRQIETHNSETLNADRSDVDGANNIKPPSWIESIDQKLLSYDREEADRPNLQIWQAPYLCVYADLERSTTLVVPPHVDGSDNWVARLRSQLIRKRGEAFKPWWLCPLKKGEYGDTAYRSMSGNIVDINRCYKEAILLLLRLYQWRSILGIDDDDIPKKQSKVSSCTPDWQRVPILPDLLQESNVGYLFADVDLVWDTRYLMLYHERSTVVLNCVPSSYSTMKVENARDFKELFRQSLLRTLEAVRGQWHAALVMSLILDTLIDAFRKPSDSRDLALLNRVAELRALYAKLLRDPLAIGTDAAALAEIRRRAHKTYEIPALFISLRDKFQAIDALITDQSMIKNLEAFRRAQEEED